MEELLSAYKVLDFTHAIAGPTTTLLMAEMGADVIKVAAYTGHVSRLGDPGQPTAIRRRPPAMSRDGRRLARPGEARQCLDLALAGDEANRLALVGAEIAMARQRRITAAPPSTPCVLVSAISCALSPIPERAFKSVRLRMSFLGAWPAWLRPLLYRALRRRDYLQKREAVNHFRQPSTPPCPERRTIPLCR
jgi:hypothetical protein